MYAKLHSQYRVQVDVMRAVQPRGYIMTDFEKLRKEHRVHMKIAIKRVRRQRTISLVICMVFILTTAALCWWSVDTVFDGIEGVVVERLRK